MSKSISATGLIAILILSTSIAQAQPEMETIAD